MPDPEIYNEKQLLLRIAEEDEQAFAMLVRQHTDKLYSYILKITKSEQWAEELVQDVWVQVWLNRKEFAVLESPIAYLHRMAQNRALDWIRKNKRELKYQYFLHQHLTEHLTVAAADKAGYEDTRQLIENAVSGLPAQRKRIFTLRQAGHSYEEIAAELQISKNTVRNQMVSALHTLRECLLRHENLIFTFLLFFF